MKKLFVLLLLAVPLVITGCGSKKRVVIFHADSLTVPMRKLVAEYEKLHPDVEIITESHGSKTCARLVKQRSCDILMVADAQIVKDMEPEYASWSAIFSTNEMVIAYSAKSKYGAEINSENWYKILARPDVNFAHSDPKLDPCGYWTLILWKLADKYYDDTVDGKSIYDALSSARSHSSIKQDAHQMLNLVDSASGLDYCFVYKNQAVEQNLKMVELPKEINLSAPDEETTYSSVSITEPIKRTGAPIEFALTLLKNAPEAEEATKFLNFFLSTKGQAILKGNKAIAAFNMVDPPIVDHPENVPVSLRKTMDIE